MRDARVGAGLHRRFSPAAAAVVLLLVGASEAIAAPDDRPLSSSGQPEASQDQPIAPSFAKPDFLFGRPRGWLAFGGSWLLPRAEGDLFAFVSDQLTIEKRDFRTPAMTAEFGLAVTPRIGALAGLEFSRQTLQSEYRRFIDNRGLPINQTTVLAQTNISGSVRLALSEPGRSVSRLAFVPRTVTPYAGAGGGFFYYELRQTGDFVDFATLRVFPDVFRSQGWTPSAHVFGGTDVRLWRILFVDVEGRYVWAHGKLGSDFIGFDGIDLDGFRVSSRLRVVF